MKTKWHCLTIEQTEWSKDNFFYKICFEERPIEVDETQCYCGFLGRIELTIYEKHKFKVGEDYDLKIS